MLDTRVSRERGADGGRVRLPAWAASPARAMLQDAGAAACADGGVDSLITAHDGC